MIIMMKYQLLTEYFNSFKDFMEDDFMHNQVKIVESYKINQEVELCLIMKKPKKCQILQKKLGPEYEALVKWNMNSVYGAISDNTSMHKQEMFNDHHSHRRSV